MRFQRHVLAAILATIFATCIVTAPGAAKPKSPFGINRDDPRLRALTFDRIQEAKIGWVRLSADWRAMEPVQGQIDFSGLDAQVQEAEANNLNIFLTFVFIPAWANGSDPSCQPFVENCSQPPSDPQFFRDFVTAVAQRYLGRIRNYGVYNEPNLAVFWTGPFQQYIDEILINGSQAIKAVDPNARIIGPDTVFSPTSFLNAVQGACAHLDILSAHFYPGHMAGAAAAMFSDIANSYLNTIQVICNKPLWVTEFGVRSEITSESIQAAEYAAAFEGILERDHIERLFLYRTEDHSPPAQLRFGIVGKESESFPRKEAFFAVQNVIANVAAARLVTVDENVGNFIVLAGPGTATQGPASATTSGLPWGFSGCAGGGACAATDNKWNVVNDAINGALVGLNVFSSHPSFENAPELAFSIAGLNPGAVYTVHLRFALDPTSTTIWGIVGRLQGGTPVVFDKDSPVPHLSLRNWNNFQEWEVVLGTARPDSSGVLKVFIDDAGLGTATLSGIRLESTVTVPNRLEIFADDFEFGDTTSWSSVCSGAC